MAERDHTDLRREYLANGFVGTPVGGFLVAAGFVLALGSSGLLYLAGAVLLLLLVGNFAVPPTDAQRPVRADIKEGCGSCGATRCCAPWRG